MRSTFILSGLAAIVLATESFLNEPDTGLETYLMSTNWTEGSQPLLKDMRGIPDFDFAARQKLDDQKYSFYRTAAGGEWSYRNNLEIWSKVKFRARFLNDVTGVNETLGTTILGYNFSSPVFISPAARAGYGDERGEQNFAEASGKENTLYVAALYASKTIEEIAEAKQNNTLNGPQVIFQQVTSPAFSTPRSRILTNPPTDLHQCQPLCDLGRYLTCRTYRSKSTRMDHRRTRIINPAPRRALRHHERQQRDLGPELVPLRPDEESHLASHHPQGHLDHRGRPGSRPPRRKSNLHFQPRRPATRPLTLTPRNRLRIPTQRPFHLRQGRSTSGQWRTIRQRCSEAACAGRQSRGHGATVYVCELLWARGRAESDSDYEDRDCARCGAGGDQRCAEDSSEFLEYEVVGGECVCAGDVGELLEL